MIGIVSQARMGSSRLPGKVLKFVKGKSLLQLHVERLQWSGSPVFIATTTNSQDDVIEKFSLSNKLGYFRGSESNVLSRYYHLALQYKLDTIVRVTSDCPLIDGHIIRDGLEKFAQAQKNNTYLTNCQKRTYPRGFDFEIFHFESLERAFKNSTQDYEFEHVTPYIWKSHPEEFNMIHYTRSGDASKFRITVDEPDDFRLIEKLVLDYNCDQLRGEEIIQVLNSHPQLSEINSHVEQKKL